MKQLDKFQEKRPDMLTMIPEAQVTGLKKEGSKVVGVTYTKGGASTTLLGPVLLATGGFIGDLKQGGLLSKHAPALLKSPTTNDERASGDGIKLAMAIGSQVKNMEKVQRFPTTASLGGDGSLQFVLSDALCGSGAMILDSTGKRFVDEMAPASQRVDAMSSAKGPFYIVVP